jgi:hypothetical protein
VRGRSTQQGARQRHRGHRRAAARARLAAAPPRVCSVRLPAVAAVLLMPPPPPPGSRLARAPPRAPSSPCSSAIITLVGASRGGSYRIRPDRRLLLMIGTAPSHRCVHSHNLLCGYEKRRGAKEMEERAWKMGHAGLQTVWLNLVTDGWEYSSSERRLQVRWYGAQHTLIPSPSKHVSNSPFLDSRQQLYLPAVKNQKFKNHVIMSSCAHNFSEFTFTSAACETRSSPVHII